MKLVVIGGSMLKKRVDGVEYAVDIGPGQWLYLIHHARYVLTNSFHGTAFSIHFRRDFYLDLSARTNSRLEHIARILGLEDRIVKNAMADAAKGCTCPPNFPMCVCGKKPKIKIITKKPILPSDIENAENSRSHSAKLRAAQKI